MKRHITLIWVVLAGAAVIGMACLVPMTERVEPGPVPAPVQSNLSGPYSHGNLSIFLIHGRDELEDEILTLQEAMDQKKVIVHETGNVNELAIENVSGEQVFVQAGDVVKGGKQDRVLGVDLMIPAQSGRLPIASFCVESGRWRGRGGEDTAKFSGSAGFLATKELKMGARLSKDQGRVWEQVAEAQGKLNKTLSTPVNAPESPSSLQLTMENETLKAESQAYIEALRGIVREHPDAIGFAFAINGEMNTVEVYASHALLEKVWPKMLRASVVEAIGERTDGTFAKPTFKQVEALMMSEQPAEEKLLEYSNGNREQILDRPDSVEFNSTWNGTYLRRSIQDK